MSLPLASCRACRRAISDVTAHPKLQHGFATSCVLGQGNPLPSRDWSRIPQTGQSSSSSNQGRPGPRQPQRRNQQPQTGGHRKPRPSKIGWNGNVTERSFGLKQEGSGPASRGGVKEDLATSLQKWNISALSPTNGDDTHVNEGTRSTRSVGRQEEGDEALDRHGRRTGKAGDRVRESRGFEAMRHASGDGEIMLNRDIRQGSKKGKERDQHDYRSSGSGSRDQAKRADKPKKTTEKAKEAEKEVYIPSTVTVSRLADIFGKKIFHLQTKMMRLGMAEDQRRADFLLTAEEACNIALEYGFNPVVDDERSFDILPETHRVGDETLPLRPPVVAIMGHVDHGKTTLLDSLRHTSVAASEAGGITQHIGAFSVPLSSLVATTPSTSDSTITFLDTPGHAAFTAMRARGASVTDIVVLVVAADDGVMPQTKEVLDLVKSENDRVGLVVAINKCDKPGLDFVSSIVSPTGDGDVLLLMSQTKVKSALGAEGILLEEDGGDVPSVKVSGLAKTGLDSLVETLSTIAELRDLRGRRDGQIQGFVLESRVDRGRGNVATVLVTRGTLHAGSVIVAGNTWARVRQMQDSQSRAIKSAPPGTPVSITGWKDLPSAGDQLLEAKDEDTAKRAVTNRVREVERKRMMADVEVINTKRREERLRAEKEAAEEEAILAAGGTLSQVHAAEKLAAAAAAAQGDGFKELRLVIKADVSGTVEAVVGSLEGIGNKEAGVKIVHTGVGEVSESDVSLAEAAGATVIGFSVPCPRSIQNHAKSANVPLHLESVIYRLIDTVRSNVAALLPPVVESRVTGEAIVQQLFPIRVKKDTVMVAGCRVSNGVINKAEKVRILRSTAGGGGGGKEREVVFEGTIETLRHLKKEVGEVRKGTECGISFEGFVDVKEGDEVVTFTTFEVPREL